MHALTSIKESNPLYKVFVSLALGELAPVVESKYSRRKRRPPISWRALLFFLLLMYLCSVRSERELERWLAKRRILLALLGLKRAPDHSTFSRFRKRLGAGLFKQLFEHLVKLCESLQLLSKRLVGQDSTDFKAYANKRKQTDSDARFGHVTDSKELVYGYKAHYATDLSSELPLSLETLPANEHDSTAFEPVMQPLLHETIQQVEKFVGDSAYDSTNIRLELRRHNIIPCIAVNGRGYCKSTNPKDPDYAKRPACERSNSRAKEFHRLDNLKLRGLANAVIHAALSLSALLLNAIAAVTLGLRNATRSPLAVRAALE
jgi:transposase